MRRLLAAALALIGGAASAQIAGDGTLGTAISRTGNSWSITAGTQLGGNLFHSFSQFGIPTSHTATFSGPNSVANIIGRVTGPDASSIDGLLRSTIPGANLWLINPRGVAFGPNAHLDVPGTLYVSTADYAKLGTSGRFNATNPGASTLSSAPPSSFGFLGPSIAPISVNGATLVDRNGLYFVGGNISVAGSCAPSCAVLGTLGGDVVLAAGGPSREFDLASRQWSASAGELGTVSLNGAVIDTRTYGIGTASGEIAIRGGSVTLLNSGLLVKTDSAVAGRGISISAERDFTMRGSDMFAGTGTSAPGSGISILAQSILISDNSTLNTDTSTTGAGGAITIRGGDAVFSGSQASARTNGPGPGGAFLIELDGRLSVQDFASLSTAANGAGRGGDFTIRARDVDLRNTGTIASTSDASGAGGRVRIDARERVVLAGGIITADTIGPATGGTVEVNAGSEIQILAGGEIRSKTVPSAPGPAGSGGTVSLSAPSVVVRDGGSITATSLGAGNAGSIFITAGTLRIENTGSIRTEALSADGGNISIKAGQLVYLRDSEISTSVNTSTGSGGNIVIDPTFVVLDHSRIIAQAAAGAGGNITIVSTYFLNMDSLIDASSHDGGVSGSVVINSPNVNPGSGVVVLSAGYFDASSLIRASCAARSARAGSSLINAGRGGLPMAGIFIPPALAAQAGLAPLYALRSPGCRSPEG